MDPHSLNSAASPGAAFARVDLIGPATHRQALRIRAGHTERPGIHAGAFVLRPLSSKSSAGVCFQASTQHPAASTGRLIAHDAGIASRAQLASNSASDYASIAAAFTSIRKVR